MDLVNFSPAERVDLADLNTAVQETPLGFARELGAYFALSPANPIRAWVLSGFAASNPTGNQIQVTLGSALLGRRVGLDVAYGVLTATGDATQAIDVSSFQSGTYGVFITFTQAKAAFQNRTFWQAGDTPGEYAQNVPTRLASTWQMTVTALNPGVEWLQVATLTLPGNALTDTRPLYFEGNAANAYASNWGTGTNDRSANRAMYGIGDLQTFTAAMRTAIEDVKGPGLTRWWENKIGGQNVGFAGTPTLGRTAWGDTNFFAQGSTTAPYLAFDATSKLTYSRSAQTFNFSAGSATALSIGATSATAPLSFGVGAAALAPLSVSSATAPQFVVDSAAGASIAAQLKLQAASGNTSLLFAPGGTTTLFEQRAVPAVAFTGAPANLGFYAGSTLMGTADANKNWILGSATSGYAYPNATTTGIGGVQSVTATYFAALTVADTSGNHLLRLDTSTASGIPAIASLRANAAATALRFSPNATTLQSTYSFALSASGTALTLGSATLPHLTIDTTDNVANFSYSATVKAQSFTPSQPYFDAYPNILLARVPKGSSATLTFDTTGGTVAVQGAINGSGIGAIFPLQVPNNATITAVSINFWRSSSTSGTNTVRFSLLGVPFTLLQGNQPTGSILATTTGQYSATYAGHALTLSSLSIAPGTYYNYAVSIGDSDSAAINAVASIHVSYTVTTLTASSV